MIAWRQRLEVLLGLATPGLDLLLAAGDRVSRLGGSEPPVYLPPAPGGALPPRGGSGDGRSPKDAV
jgi:hypothetical protein